MRALIKKEKAISVNRVESREQIETFFDAEKIAREGKQLCKEAIAALEKSERIAKIAFKIRCNYVKLNPEIYVIKESAVKNWSTESEVRPIDLHRMPKLFKYECIEFLEREYGGINSTLSFNFSFTLSIYGSHGTLLKERTWKVQK